MNEFTPSNPFVVGKYISDKYFCDREKETDFLIKQIENGRNVALISPRRLGKTGLILHCFNQDRIKNNYHTFFIDIYATNSMAEFVYLLGKAVYDKLKPQQTIWKEKFFQTIKSLRAGFKLDPITGEPAFDIGFGDIQTPQTTIDEIFEYLEESDKPCVIAIDEFQQIGNYKENNVEAMLRTKIQQCKKTSFVFSGSKRHLMNNMFNSPSKPFYQSVITIGLSPIPYDTYSDFVNNLFEENGRHIDKEVTKRVYNKFSGYTWFMQIMMNELYALTSEHGICSVEMLDTAWQNIISAQEGSYKDILSNMPQKQKMVLQAIAKENTAQNITSSAFIKKYNLPSASSIQSATRALLKNDIITQDGNSYRIYDYFFSEWFANIY